MLQFVTLIYYKLLKSQHINVINAITPTKIPDLVTMLRSLQDTKLRSWWWTQCNIWCKTHENCHSFGVYIINRCAQIAKNSQLLIMSYYWENMGLLTCAS